MESKNNGLNVPTVSEAIRGAIDSLGNVDLGGVKLNDPTGDLLNLNSSSITLDVHVAMHPAMIAYYGAVKKEAGRMLAAEKRAYDRWSKKSWAEAKVKCSGEYKPTREDIESRLVTDNMKVIEEWEGRIDKLQELFDTLDVFCEALRQKSFAMRDHVSMEEEERFNTSSSMGRTDGGRTDAYQGAQVREELNSEKIRKVRDIIRKRRNGQGV